MEALQYFGGGNVLKYCIAKKIVVLKIGFVFFMEKSFFSF